MFAKGIVPNSELILVPIESSMTRLITLSKTEVFNCFPPTNAQAHSSSVMCYCMYPGVQGGAKGSVGEAAWERWWSRSDFSCCLYDNYREKKREININETIL